MISEEREGNLRDRRTQSAKPGRLGRGDRRRLGVRWPGARERNTKPVTVSRISRVRGKLQVQIQIHPWQGLILGGGLSLETFDVLHRDWRGWRSRKWPRRTRDRAEGGDGSDGTGTWSGRGRTSKKRPRMTVLTNGDGRGGIMAKGVTSTGSGERAGEGMLAKGV